MKLPEERKVEVLKETFPDLNEDKAKQALECANSDVTLAINKVLEVTSEYQGSQTPWKSLKNSWILK